MSGTRLFGWIFLVGAAVVIACLRWKGRDLTEMQLLVTYWPAWAYVALLLLAAVMLLGRR